MIPDNPNIYEITDLTRPLLSPFQYPDDVIAESELEDWEKGGIALQNTSEGLNYQVWRGYWNPSDSTVYVVPDNTGIPIPLFTKPNVVEFSFTFDSNMRWSTACRDSAGNVEHRWYDAAIANYAISIYTGVTSVKLTLDDKRSLQIVRGVSDMIVTYLKSTRELAWRIQRDRFLVEYVYGGRLFTPQSKITHFGMSTTNRLQWRIGPRHLNI